MSSISHFTLIIGAMKCGTSSLYNYISQHRQVCSCIQKEPMYFSNSEWLRDREEYQKLWPGYNSSRHKTALEASTEYTKFPHFPNVADRIYEYSCYNKVQFKFIYIIRNPLDLINSGLRHAQYAKWGNLDRDLVLKNLINVSNYSLQIDNYIKKFPREDMLVITFEELKNQPSRLMQKIVSFLELSEYHKFNTDKAYNTASERESAYFEKKSIIRKSFHRLPFFNQFKKLAYNISPNTLVNNSRDILYNTLLKRIQYPQELVDIAASEEWKLGSTEIDELKSRLHNDLLKLQDYGVDVSQWLINCDKH